MSHHSFLKYSVCSLSVRLVTEMRGEDILGTYSTFGMVAGSHSPFIFMIIRIVPIAVAWIDQPSPTVIGIEVSKSISVSWSNQFWCGHVWVVHPESRIIRVLVGMASGSLQIRKAWLEQNGCGLRFSARFVLLALAKFMLLVLAPPGLAPHWFVF